MSYDAYCEGVMMEEIAEFHEKFKLKPKSSVPKLLSAEQMGFRLHCLDEEMDEMYRAYAEGDLEKTADAIVDLVYFALGTAYLMNLPFDELWQEVHAANMQKVRAKKKGDSKRGSAYDVVKPEGWQPPNLKLILQRHGARFKKEKACSKQK